MSASQLGGKASPLYLDSLEAMEMALTRNEVPGFLPWRRCFNHHGLVLTVVPGLIPVEDFSSFSPKSGSAHPRG